MMRKGNFVKASTLRYDSDFVSQVVINRQQAFVALQQQTFISLQLILCFCFEGRISCRLVPQ